MRILRRELFLVVIDRGMAMGCFSNILSRIFQWFPLVILLLTIFRNVWVIQGIPPIFFSGILPGILSIIHPEIYPQIQPQIPPGKILQVYFQVAFFQRLLQRLLNKLFRIPSTDSFKD